MPLSPHARPLVLCLAAIVVVAAVFALFPGLDPAVSGWTHFPERGGFSYDAEPAAQRLRNLLRGAMNATFALCLVGALMGAAGRRLWAVPGRVYEWALLVFALGPGLIVDVLLKSYWGRARPADVTIFGGEARYSPFWLPTDQCADNCSFVSGEGAGAAASALALAAILRAAPVADRRPALVVIWGLAGLTGAMRVAMGRHFVSDVVLSFLIVAAIGAALRLIPRYRYVRP
ncbi:phosphatase PAP2 family protein [Palleronia sediminis]|uniref:Phosphatase PAP2 family protein n=1 Tax=Palleronia sediminis TaxID=2547833 RepID=A0A4R6A273_9RHOB|nr:phosphatase PAP2 family protein [Palleronia sediminis]TDL77691.1 phosphatase PAP2 family protein [Palleronia sediminis]